METSMSANGNTGGQPPPPAEKPIKYFDKEVKHRLSLDEIQKYGQKLANCYSDKKLLEDEAKRVAAEYTNKKKTVEVEIARLSNALNRGEELRLQSVYEVWNNGVIEIRMKSTGEVVDSRSATIADRQATFSGLDRDGDDEGEDDDIGDDVTAAEGHDLEAHGAMSTSATGGEVFTMPDDEPEPTVFTKPGGAPPQDGFDDEAGELEPEADAENEISDEVDLDEPAKKNGTNGKARSAGAERRSKIAASKKGSKKKK